MKFYLITLVLLQYLYNIVHSAVLGIDFGSSFYKISLIAPKKNFVIVESMGSQRKIESAVSFSDQRRHFETDAVSKKTRYPTNTFTFPQRFLEALDNNQTVIETKYNEYEEFLLSFNEEFRTVQFELEDFTLVDLKDKNKNSSKPEKIIVKIEEILGMIFKNAKFLAEKMAELKDIKECIITVPSYWSFTARNLLQTGASIGGLKIIRLINENTAAAIHFSKDRNDIEPFQTLFYNIGANSIQASLVEYQILEKKGKTIKDKKTSQIIRVLADSGISNFGGSMYDIEIAEFFAEQIDAYDSRQGKESVKKDKQIMQKLIMSSKKVKEILSANKKAHINIEGLYDNTDFESDITREQFLERCQFLLEKVLEPIKDVLKKSGKSVKDIDQVELIGGGIRVPKIQEILKEFLGEEIVGTHLNGDESMALGASLYAAQLNHGLKAKQILLFDGFNYSFDIQIRPYNSTVDEDSDDYININEELFSYKQRHGSQKDFNIQTLQDLKVRVSKKDFNGIKTPFATFKIENIANITNHKNYNATHQRYPSIRIQFENDNLQGPYISFNQVNFTYVQEVRNPKRKSQMKNKNMSPANNGTEGEKNYTITYRKKVQQIKLNITTKHHDVQPYTKVQVIRTRRLIQRFEQIERKVKNMGSNKHKLENLIYETRDQLKDDTYIDFSTAEEREKISSIIEKFQEWIQRQDIEHPQAQIKGRLAQLEKLTAPIKTKIEESKNRPKAIREARQKITKIKEGVEDLTRTHAWIEEKEKQQLNQRIQSTQQWIRQKQNEQKEKQNHESPAFQISELNFKVEQLQEGLKTLRNTKKPKSETSKSDSKKKSEKKTDL